MTGPNPSTLGVDAIINDPGKLQWVLQQTGLSGTSVDDILRNAMLGYNSAGSEQWRQNVASGAQGPIGPALQNVGMDSDINALRRIVGEATGYLSRGQGSQLADIWRQRSSSVNPTFAGAFDQVTGQNGSLLSQLLETAGGQRYGVGTQYEGTNAANTTPQGARAGQGLQGWLPDLLVDLNLDDPSRLLFDPNNPPASLSQLTGGQRGETAMLAGLSGQEFIDQVMPRYYDYFNRAPGTAAPGLGPMFGESSYNDALSGSFMDQQGNVFGNPVQRGFLTETPGYERWSAYGQPGTGMPGAGTVSGAYGDSINPATGAGSAGQGQPGNSLAQALLSGQLQPQYFAGDYQPGQTWADNPEFVRNVILPALGGIGTAQFLGDPSYYWASYPNVNTGDQDALTRMLQLAMAQVSQQQPAGLAA